MKHNNIKVSNSVFIIFGFDLLQLHNLERFIYLFNFFNPEFDFLYITT